jgi:PAS domain S-box-containing protein
VNFLSRLFDPTGFPARWECGPAWRQDPWLGWLHIGSDLGVWGAYVAIPLVLGYFIVRRKDLPFRTIFLLFGAFILACGTTHLMEAIIFYWPAYRLAGLIKLFTALVSWATVFSLFGVVPNVLAMRSPQELEREIKARKQAEAALQQTNAELELRVDERTAELMRAVTALRDERELLRTTLASIGDGVLVTDTEARVTFLNGVGETLTGWTTAEAAKLPLEQVFRIANEHSREPVENPAVRALQEGSIIGLANHTILQAKDGTERPIDDSAAPIRSDNGDIRGAVLVFRDITERKAALNKLTEQEERLRLAVDATGLGIFDYDPRTRQRSWTARCKEIFGLSPEADVRSAEMLTAVHADDRQRVIREFERSLDPDGSGEFMMEYRVLHPDQTQVWVFARGKTIFANVDGAPRAVRSLGTVIDITERKRSEEALRQSELALLAADRHKDEFLATLAHELRNPLAPIRNSLEVMKRSGENPAVMENSRAMIERQMSQMVRLVDDLIDVSRISRNQLVLQRERVPLAGIVQHAVEACRPAIDAANHELVVELPAKPIHVQADSVRLVQVLGNLLTNACKYTEPGGKIWVTAVQEGSEAVVSVRDNGVGIPPKLLPKAFEMFAQLDRTLARSQGGLGIGLALVKRLVELHGGTVTAHSGGPNLGTEFIIRLPIQPEPLAQKSAAAVPEKAVSGRRILVVDDNRDAALTMAMLLKLTGNELQTAHDGLEAVSKAAEFQPEIVLLDIGMPVMNGYDACRAMRQQPWGKQMRIVALTGWGQDDDRRQSQEAGFDAHLVKPVEHATLVKTLEELSSA